MSTINILIAEDDTNIRSGLVDTLESEGYQTASAGNGNEAFELFHSGKYDLIITVDKEFKTELKETQNEVELLIKKSEL